MNKTENLVKELKEKVEKEKYVNVKKGMETKYGVSKETFRKALNILIDEGTYNITYIEFKSCPKELFKVLAKKDDGFGGQNFDEMCKRMKEMLEAYLKNK